MVALEMTLSVAVLEMIRYMERAVQIRLFLS